VLHNPLAQVINFIAAVVAIFMAAIGAVKWVVPRRA